MSKVSDFLNSKIVKSDVGEETVLTWKETLSYALGRGAQGMNTSMTSSKYINFFLTDVLFKKLSNPMGVASKIRFFCGIFDAINDPMMGVLVDKTRTKDGQMRPLYQMGAAVRFARHGAVLRRQRKREPCVQHYLHDLPFRHARRHLHGV